MQLHIEKAPVTWIVVADGKTAQVYTRKLAPVLAKPLMAESATIYQMGRNQTGMVHESIGAARHSRNHAQA